MKTVATIFKTTMVGLCRLKKEKVLANEKLVIQQATVVKLKIGLYLTCIQDVEKIFLLCHFHRFSPSYTAI